MHYFYSLLAVLLTVTAVPVFIYRLIREEGFGERLKQSFGILPKEVIVNVANKQAIWLHAASVGEIVAASPIAREIKNQMPERTMVISVVTTSGYEMAKRIIPQADGLIYFPLDLPWLSNWVVRAIKPAIILLVETELWPNFLKTARKSDIPVMMVNGRISDKSVNRYRYLGSVLQDMIMSVKKFCMQSSIDVKRIISLGANPELVFNTGNTKYDQTYTEVSAEEKEQLMTLYGFKERGPIIVAGSTHRGEEEYLFTALAYIRTIMPQVVMLLAPRDILRVEEVEKLAAEYGFNSLRRSTLPGKSQEHDVVILDTIGELGRVYSLGDVIFVGGSLVARGGHNILEPAAHGKPIIVGPHMFNFKEIHALLTKSEACLTVTGQETLSQALREILQNNELAMRMSENSWAVIKANRGAAIRNVQELKKLEETLKRRN